MDVKLDLIFPYQETDQPVAVVEADSVEAVVEIEVVEEVEVVASEEEEAEVVEAIEAAEVVVVVQDGDRYFKYYLKLIDINFYLFNTV